MSDPGTDHKAQKRGGGSHSGTVDLFNCKID
jgi:hypothetical protein